MNKTDDEIQREINRWFDEDGQTEWQTKHHPKPKRHEQETDNNNNNGYSKVYRGRGRGRGRVNEPVEQNADKSRNKPRGQIKSRGGSYINKNRRFDYNNNRNNQTQDDTQNQTKSGNGVSSWANLLKQKEETQARNSPVLSPIQTDEIINHEETHLSPPSRLSPPPQQSQPQIQNFQQISIQTDTVRTISPPPIVESLPKGDTVPINHKYIPTCI